MIYQMNLNFLKYLSDTIFFYNASDFTKIPLREKLVKVEKEKKPKNKVGRPKKGEVRESIEPSKLQNMIIN